MLQYNLRELTFNNPGSYIDQEVVISSYRRHPIPEGHLVCVTISSSTVVLPSLDALRISATGPNLSRLRILAVREIKKQEDIDA